ncbi:hypothetical protein QMZ92_24260 [Streptomyces sp. HNM0645]|uniref:hypothetical protein n=1 Tax=Streptomyces sp. HNM0645 TaxID=2782343 RepID=UPI0024B85CC4|nr:hypothetical protein [Streptomyces sp. HNM0645]MDI9887400.1 hypothetical protein [Streptomyces sp. HNM0645]
MGHSFMSGHDLPSTALLGALGLTAAGGWLAGTRRRGALPIGAALLGVQGALHLLFARSEPHTAGDLPPHHRMSAGGLPGTTADAAVPGTVPARSADTLAADAVAQLTQHITGPAGMLAAHVLAAAVCALWLARGEAAFFRLARTVGTVCAAPFAPLRLLLAAACVPEPARPARPGHRTRRPHGVVLTHSLSRRGPPGAPTTRATVPGALV